ncbi:MAG: inorganic phosphate transporter [Lewinellaceae bacterium]|nr:inorganic phosphate transporter [Lewinellaceae bacterium]
METIYIALVLILFLLAISDLVVGVSNDAVNFLNSAIGAKAATMKTIMVVAALGILAGAVFSSGMMEVARKGIFNPQYFYFSEIIILFLAVMITDVLLLDAFNTFGLPTSTTVSLVFELLGAATAITLVKVYSDANALPFYEYINSAKALAIISGILVSVVLAFSAGMIVQYLSRALFSFDYEKRLKYLGAPWGGLAISGLTYFMVLKGAEGASFLTEDVVNYFNSHAWSILAAVFIGSTAVLQLLAVFTRFDILKFVVLAGTFALAMAFAGNDLVNFIGVPLAGFHSYEIFTRSGSDDPGGFLMEGLAGKVSTPTYMLLIAGLIMAITLWASKKARSVVRTSLDLGRQDAGGYERFSTSLLSRSIVRMSINLAAVLEKVTPAQWRDSLRRQFDEQPFLQKQAAMGNDAPAFDMIRASVTLIVSSILIAAGTTLKLPLSTTYVTFMAFMGASLADGAWGRESAVYRVTGMLSVVGGWFFTAISAFAIAFVVAIIFQYGGMAAIAVMLILAAFIMYRTHKYHGAKLEEEAELEQAPEAAELLTKEAIIEKSRQSLSDILGRFSRLLGQALNGLGQEGEQALKETSRELEKLYKKTASFRQKANRSMNRIRNEDLQAGLYYILVADYLHEMALCVQEVVKSSLDHVRNHHKPLLPAQMEELNAINDRLKGRFSHLVEALQGYDPEKRSEIAAGFQLLIKEIRDARKNQVKRIQSKEVGTRNSTLFFNHLSEYRNLALFSSRILKVYEDMVVNGEEEEGAVPPGATAPGT